MRTLRIFYSLTNGTSVYLCLPYRLKRRYRKLILLSRMCLSSLIIRSPTILFFLMSRWSSFPLKPRSHTGPLIKSLGWALKSPAGKHSQADQWTTPPRAEEWMKLCLLKTFLCSILVMISFFNHICNLNPCYTMICLLMELAVRHFTHKSISNNLIHFCSVFLFWCMHINDHLVKKSLLYLKL